MPKTTTILFDCDNTLVKSEELAFQACASLSNKILENEGLDVRYTGPQLQRDFVGQNFRGMLHGLVERHKLKISENEIDSQVDKELAEVISKLRSAPVEPCDGAIKALEDVNTNPGPHGTYLLSVVSSSALPRVEAALEVTGMSKYFGDRIYSAATSLPVPTSKPKPDIYIHAYKELKVKPTECVAIEDSRSGATAAVAAGIPLIGYVGVYDDPVERREAEEMLKQVGAIAILQHWDDLRDSLKKVEEAELQLPKI